MSRITVRRPGYGKITWPVPQADEVRIEDIAHSLSNQCRFNGMTSTFFSTAQHSMEVCTLVMERVRERGDSDVVVARAGLAGLLHDAPEYAIGDVVSPLKKQLGVQFHVVERRAEHVVFKGLGVASIMEEHHDDVAWADEEMLVSDMARWDIFCETTINGRPLSVQEHGKVPAPYQLRFGRAMAHPPSIQLRTAFIERYRELRRAAEL